MIDKDVLSIGFSVLALQLHFLFEMRPPRFGLVGASPQ
jgi:hypothetical protein